MDEIAEMIRDWVQQYGPRENDETFEPGKFGYVGKERLLEIADLAERAPKTSHYWPVDKRGVELEPGCVIHLDHNGKDREVACMMLRSDGKWSIGCDEGGSFLMPDSEDDVTVLPDDMRLRDKLYDLVLSCVSISGYRTTEDGKQIPVLACDEDFLDDWMSEHEGEIVLGDA